VRDLGCGQLLVPDMLGLDSRYVRVPCVFEKDALLHVEVESNGSSGAMANNTQVVVEGPPNDIVRCAVVCTVDLESESRVYLLVPDGAVQGFNFDPRHGRLEHLDLLWRGSNYRGRVQPPLVGHQVIESLEEFNDEVLVL